MNLATTEAEWAAERLVARLAEYRSLANSRTLHPMGRHTARLLSTHDTNALVDLAAIVESFVVARLTGVSNPASNETRSWDARQKAWKKYTGVDLTSFPRWLAFMGFIEARNALQHGLGRLTDRQLGKHKQEVLSQLDAAAVQRNGDLLLISADDILRCGRICQEFIGWLDSAAPTPT
jgi:hypothetical protein